jgi:hypothetical protein
VKAKMGKIKLRQLNNRALSPIFATLLLASIVITFGTVAYYYANNVTKTTTNNYVDSVVATQQSVSERVGFEQVFYTKPNLGLNPQVPGTLRVSIINSGFSNGLNISYLFLYDSSDKLLGYFPLATKLSPIEGGPPFINGLNIHDEGSFTGSLKTATGAILPELTHGTMYRIHLLTEKGSTFDYEYATPSQ